MVAALAGLLIVLCLLWSIARWLVYEPRWMLSSRHSLEEASFPAYRRVFRSLRIGCGFGR